MKLYNSSECLFGLLFLNFDNSVQSIVCWQYAVSSSNSIISSFSSYGIYTTGVSLISTLCSGNLYILPIIPKIVFSFSS